MSFKIGIDLSSQKTGVVVLDKDNNYLSHKLIKIKPFKIENIQNIIFSLESQLESVLRPFSHVYCEIYIEKNLRHPTQVLHLGLWLKIINDIFSSYKIIWIHPWQWYKKMEGSQYKDKKETRKQRTKDFGIKQLQDITKEWNEDLFDAYCIAYYGGE